jgi:hypothetical protein
MTKVPNNPSSSSRTPGRRLRRRPGRNGGGREAEAITMPKVENQIEDTGTAVTGAPKAGESGALPVLIMMLGRGRVGKTATATTLIQYYRSAGGQLQVWNADQQNETHSLSRFHMDALEPRAGSTFEDRKRWLEDRIQDQSRERFHALIDFPGGDSTVLKLAQETRLIRLLKRMGIRPVAVHVVGPEKADLDYLRHMAAADVFMPEATLIVLNGGLVQSGQSIDQSFAEIMTDSVILDAVSKGAVVITMPALPCMSDIMDLGISFRDAADGRFETGEELLSLFNRARTEIFLEEEIPEALSGIPLAWTPAAKEA